MDGLQCVEGRVAEGIGKTVEFAQHIGAGGGIAVDANGARKLVDAAADVEYPHRM